MERVDAEKPITGVKRAALLDEIRREQRRERARLTPGERLARAAEMLAVGRALHGVGRGDESAELLLRVRAAFRERTQE